MKLSSLAIGLGFLMALPQVYALWRPQSFAAAARRFPRSESWGYALMALGAAWFLWNLNQETISDFASYKRHMLIGFAAIAVLTCIYVRDFLAVRGLAIVLLLLSKLALDTARWHESQWRLIISVLAYVWIVAGMWFTISPWRLRDMIQWSTENVRRIRVTSGIRLALGLLLIVLGLTAF